MTRASTRSGAFTALLTITTLDSDFLFVTGSFNGAAIACAITLDKGFAFDAAAAGLVPAFAATFTTAGLVAVTGFTAPAIALTGFATALTAGFATGLTAALPAAFALGLTAGGTADFTADFTAGFAVDLTGAGAFAAALGLAAGIRFFAGFFIAFAIESTNNRVALGYSVTAHGRLLNYYRASGALEQQRRGRSINALIPDAACITRSVLRLLQYACCITSAVLRLLYYVCCITPAVLRLLYYANNAQFPASLLRPALQFIRCRRTVRRCTAARTALAAALFAS